MSGALCPLCGRPLGTLHVDRHHLIPKTYKGREQFDIHKICHQKIHSTFTEHELFKSFHTWEALQQHEDIKAFIAWVSKKDPSYFSRNVRSNNKRKR